MTKHVSRIIRSIWIGSCMLRCSYLPLASMIKLFTTVASTTCPISASFLKIAACKHISVHSGAALSNEHGAIWMHGTARSSVVWRKVLLCLRRFIALVLLATTTTGGFHCRSSLGRRRRRRRWLVRTHPSVVVIRRPVSTTSWVQVTEISEQKERDTTHDQDCR